MALITTSAADAGTLTGTTLKSTVVLSSLTSVGTIGTGVWNGSPVNYQLNIEQALGSVIKAATLPLGLHGIITHLALGAGTVAYQAVWLPQAAIITGVKWYQGTSGVYTASTYNGIGLYSYTGGVMTLVASSTDDGLIWKATGGTIASKAFSSTYSASAGLYFVVFLYANSAQTTAPTIGRGAAITNTPISAGDFTNSAKYQGFVAGTTLPSTITMSTTTGSSSPTYFGIY